jgi:hypothetical protein
MEAKSMDGFRRILIKHRMLIHQHLPDDSKILEQRREEPGQSAGLLLGGTCLLASCEIPEVREVPWTHRPVFSGEMGRVFLRGGVAKLLNMGRDRFSVQRVRAHNAQRNTRFHRLEQRLGNVAPVLAHPRNSFSDWTSFTAEGSDN